MSYGPYVTIQYLVLFASGQMVKIFIQYIPSLPLQKITEWMEVLFGAETPGPKKHCIRFRCRSANGEGKRMGFRVVITQLLQMAIC